MSGADQKRKMKQLVFRRARGKCEYCGKQLSMSTATLDHFRAKVRGGGGSKSNLRLACSECNNSKGDKDGLSWLIEQQAKVVERVDTAGLKPAA